MNNLGIKVRLNTIPVLDRLPEELADHIQYENLLLTELTQSKDTRGRMCCHLSRSEAILITKYQ